uniref:Calcium calmodulin-dependent 3-cyclic nucleotide phosphodiesterase 1c-like n=1 Tax=Tetraselmis sp. GSL018 TaxID=582737 RepID=A0A061R4S2_9CHLO
MLLAVGLGYLRLRKTLRSITGTKLDVDSPVIKAYSALKELSAAKFVTPGQRQRALHAAMALMYSENVNAPDLSTQKLQGSDDIAAYLKFSSDATSPKGGADGLSHGARSGPADSMQPVDAFQGWDPLTSPSASGDLEGGLNPLGFELVHGAGTDLFFNAFFAAKMARGRPLFVVAMRCVHSFGLVRALDLDAAAMEAFFTHIENGHNNVPYHSSTHAADVVSRTCAILRSDRILTESPFRSDLLLLLSAILAAVVHDFRHPGLSNSFHVATGSDISLEFNEQSVVENMSLSRALRALRTDEFNFLRNLTGQEQRGVHSNTVKMVLATDMSRHFDVVAAFHSQVRPPSSLPPIFQQLPLPGYPF